MDARQLSSASEIRQRCATTESPEKSSERMSRSSAHVALILHRAMPGPAGSEQQAVVWLQPKEHAARHFPGLERDHRVLVDGLDIAKAPIECVTSEYR